MKTSRFTSPLLFLFLSLPALTLSSITPIALAMAGKNTEFPVPTPKSVPFGITVGPDGNLWFAEDRGNKIAFITPS